VKQGMSGARLIISTLPAAKMKPGFAFAAFCTGALAALISFFSIHFIQVLVAIIFTYKELIERTGSNSLKHT